MKTIINRTALILAALFLAVAGSRAASETNLYSFSVVSAQGTNADGSGPMGDLVSSNGTLYGTTADGGTNGLGTIFAMNITNPEIANIHNFDEATNGSGPVGAMVSSGDMLYGTTRAGGVYGLGTVFAISTTGGGFMRLHSFGTQLGDDPATQLNTNSGGAFPETDLVYSSNTLYGATEQGGSGGNGTLFKINTDGMGFMLLHNFTNQDGGYPSVHMALSGTNLYGTTEFGGSNSDVGSGAGNGTIFRVNTDGSGFTNLYNFADSTSGPNAGVVLSSNYLYGTTGSGFSGLGASGGALFRINTDGTGYTNLYFFDQELGGNTPSVGLAIHGSSIYGTEVGEASFGGTVFGINTDGTGYTNLTGFNSPGDPGTLSGLDLYSGTLYCTAWSGGANNAGVVFAVILAPTLEIQLIKSAVVLSWSDPSFSLYTAPAVNGVYTNISLATSPHTNAIGASQQYFRLQ